MRDETDANEDMLAVALDAALPRGIRKPVPGPAEGEPGGLAGKEIEAERRF